MHFKTTFFMYLFNLKKNKLPDILLQTVRNCLIFVNEDKNNNSSDK